jgi:cyclohexyl-isocyanide hydratase
MIRGSCACGGVRFEIEAARSMTHWAFTDLLPLVGATHEKASIVKDGNLITAGGVTSGIDFGLSVSAEIADPAPPFSCGHPDRAPRGFVESLAGSYDQMSSDFRAGLERITRQ